jgi:spermidine synthase
MSRSILAVIGFTATVAQIVLMRELVATCYGNELLFGLILAAWLVWGAVGASAAARCPHPPFPSSTYFDSAQYKVGGTRRWAGGKVVATGLVAAALLLPAQLALVRGVRALLGVTPGALVEFGPMVVAIVLIVAPLCLLLGALFTVGARLIAEQGGSGGQAYVWESIGAVAGGALFSFIFIRWLDPFQTALVVSSANLAVAARIWLAPRPEQLALSSSKGFRPRLARPGQTLRVWRPISICCLFLLLLAASYFLGRSFHQATLRWQWANLIFAADSPYGRLTVQGRDGQRSFYTDGRLAFETQGTFPEEVAHFPLLAHPAPKEVLLIGGGVAGDLREILKHPITSVSYVELDPLLIQAARAFLPPEDAAVLQDPRVAVVLDDGRRYVKAIASAPKGFSNTSTPLSTRPFGSEGHTFDVVILDLPEPATGALNRFYTVEFFTEVRAILHPAGILALHLPSAENYWSPELARRNASVYRTLKAAFPEVLALPGEHTFFLASEQPLESDPTVLAGRLTERGVQTRWVTADYVGYVLTGDRFAQTLQILERLAGGGVRLNRDLAPICYFYDLALWLSLFYPRLRGAFESASLVNLGWIAGPLLLLVALGRWRRRWVGPIVVAGVGLAQMMLEVVLLFAFQVLHGYAYAEVSLIVTAFMGGLAAGSMGSNRLLRSRYFDSAQYKQVKRKTQDARQALLAVMAALALYSAALPFLFSRPIPAPAVTFPLLGLLAGCLGGMVFPLAVALRVEERRSESPDLQSAAAGILYAADLAGGCAGALGGAVLLVPLLGISQTCVASALVALAGLIVLV